MPLLLRSKNLLDSRLCGPRELVLKLCRKHIGYNPALRACILRYLRLCPKIIVVVSALIAWYCFPSFHTSLFSIHRLISGITWAVLYPLRWRNSQGEYITGLCTGVSWYWTRRVKGCVWLTLRLQYNCCLWTSDPSGNKTELRLTHFRSVLS